MKGKLIGALLALAVGGFLAWSVLFKGEGDDESSHVRASFNSFSLGVAQGEPKMIERFISPTFTDSKIQKEDLLKILSMKRKIYTALISSVAVSGDIASVAYQRTEIRGEDGEPINIKIAGETWVRDKTKPGSWKLHKLADADTWFRTTDIPRKQVLAAADKKKESRVLGELDKNAPAPMSASARYNAAGRRDPFRPLIAMGAADSEVAILDQCDPDRPRELLENFDLDSLKLSGIIVGDKGNVALIETPDGKGYTLSKNMYIGKRCGKVVEMQGDYILVKEKIRKPGAQSGDFTTIDTPIQLRREEG